MSIQAELDDNDIYEVARRTWQSIMGTELCRVTPDTDSAYTGEILTAGITLKGKWNGGVIVICPAMRVREAASALFGTQPGDIALDDLKDLLGEVANTIAGGLTEWLPSPITLSLPVVTNGSDLGLLRGKVIQELALDCNASPVNLLVIQAP